MSIGQTWKPHHVISYLCFLLGQVCLLDCNQKVIRFLLHKLQLGRCIASWCFVLPKGTMCVRTVEMFDWGLLCSIFELSYFPVNITVLFSYIESIIGLLDNVALIISHLNNFVNPNICCDRFPSEIQSAHHLAKIINP